MAARLRKIHQDDVRSKIKTSQLINRLTDHGLGKVEMTSSQVRAAEVVLKKAMPDLSSIELQGGDGGPVIHRVELVAANVDSPDTPPS